MIDLKNIDCMDYMATLPDKAFELAIVDPPYGIGASEKNSTNKRQCKKSAAQSVNYGTQQWDDNIPNDYYFNELIRVSKKQIIWGANYYGMRGGMLFWDKQVTMPTYSQGELAWLSFQNKVDYVKIVWHGMIQENMSNKEQRIHPTQKPVALYKWLLSRYAKPGDRILDTHGGSMSSAIACGQMNFDITLCELDLDYFTSGCQRVLDYFRAQNLFAPQPEIKINGLNAE
jgi:site-specific DNA-methyltransferase (adenine-specific)